MKILNFVQIFRICLMLLNFIVSFLFFGFFTNTLVAFFWWMILCNLGNIPWNVLFQGIMANFFLLYIMNNVVNPQNIMSFFSFLNCINFWRKKKTCKLYSPKRKYVKIVVLFKLSYFPLVLDIFKQYFRFLFLTLIQIKKAEKKWKCEFSLSNASHCHR